jgi:hypothetical protein
MHPCSLVYQGTEPEHSLQITETEHSGSSSQRPARLLPSWPFWLAGPDPNFERPIGQLRCTMRSFTYSGPIHRHPHDAFVGSGQRLSAAAISLVCKFAHARTFRHLGRQCCRISRVEAASAIFTIRIDGYYAFDCRGAGCPTLNFRTKRSQHQRRLHLRNIGPEEAAKNDEPKHRRQFANWM